MNIPTTIRRLTVGAVVAVAVTAATTAMGAVASPPPRTPASTSASTPAWWLSYDATVSGVQVTLATPSGPVTVGGCTHEVGGAAWDGLSEDCRDLVADKASNVALMARYDASAATVRDVDLDGSPKTDVLQRWTRDVAGDRFDFRYFPFAGMPYKGYGEFECNADGVQCHYIHAMQRSGAARSARARRLYRASR